MNNLERIESLLISSESMTKAIGEIQTTLSSLLESRAADFTENQKTAIKTIMGEAVASMAQPPHDHGGSPKCPECVQLAQQAVSTSINKGIAEASTYYNKIPGVTRLREIYEEAQIAHANGEQVLNIVG